MTNFLRKRLSSSSSCVLSENVLFWSYFVMYSISRLVSMFEHRFNYIDFYRLCSPVVRENWVSSIMFNFNITLNF